MSIKNRKVIQIAATTKFTVALCDDGTMWVCIAGPITKWQQVDPIPQPNEFDVPATKQGEMK